MTWERQVKEVIEKIELKSMSSIEQGAQCCFQNSKAISVTGYKTALSHGSLLLFNLKIRDTIF